VPVLARAASTLLAVLVCAPVAAPGAGATDTVEVEITNGTSDEIIVNSQGSMVASGDGKVSSKCSAEFPLMVQPGGQPYYPCTLTLDADPGTVIAQWELGGAYQGAGFSSTAYPGDPTVGKVQLCWVVNGQLFQADCFDDNPPPSGGWPAAARPRAPARSR
jgi:hypothetical protein